MQYAELVLLYCDMLMENCLSFQLNLSIFELFFRWRQLLILNKMLSFLEVVFPSIVSMHRIIINIVNTFHDNSGYISNLTFLTNLFLLLSRFI